MKNKVVIIGTGNVGMSFAYALLNQKTKVNELVLIDLNYQRVLGEVMDLNHGSAFGTSKLHIKAGDYSDCNDAAIVCICAGINQKTGETRLEVLEENTKIFKSIVDKVIGSGFNGIFLIATNPVDIMTYITYKYSNFPKSRVIGSGTTLDTARLRYLIGEKLKLNPKNIHAYALGEHGDSEFVSWSNAYAGSISLTKLIPKNELDNIASSVKNAAYEIINKKGSTHYAIGMVLVRITNAILDDENSILTVSSYNEKHNVFIGYPSIVNKDGVREIMNIGLNEEEQNKFDISASLLKDVINKINI